MIVARLEQDYAGHGIVVQPVLQRGFIGVSERPAAPPSDSGSAQRMVIHVHLREKVMPIQCGEGKQRVFWLAITTVQRYLTDMASYGNTFSAELTPKRILSESLECISSTGRIRDELKNGEHVWVDVGDDVAISRVRSRPFTSEKILDGDEVEEAIEWVQSPDRRDARRVMRYSRTSCVSRQSRLSFAEWRASGRIGLPLPEDEGDDTTGQLVSAFNMTWDAMKLGDLPGFLLVATECKAIMFKHFEKICWIFSSYAALSNAIHVMSLSEFWAFCKDVNAPTIHLNLTRATLLFTQIDTKYKDDPYNPRRGFNLHEFMEGIVRLSVLRQGNPANPKVGLPDCLEDFLLNHVLRDNENFRDSQQTRIRLSDKSCREIFARHDKAIRKMFLFYASRNIKHPGALEFADWARIFRISNLMDKSLHMKAIKRAFVHAQLGETLIDEATGTELDTLETLIFPE